VAEVEMTEVVESEEVEEMMVEEVMMTEVVETKEMCLGNRQCRCKGQHGYAQQ